MKKLCLIRQRFYLMMTILHLHCLLCSLLFAIKLFACPKNCFFLMEQMCFLNILMFSHHNLKSILSVCKEAFIMIPVATLGISSGTNFSVSDRYLCKSVFTCSLPGFAFLADHIPQSVIQCAIRVKQKHPGLPIC